MKLELLTSKDDLRPTLCRVLVTKDVCVATDAQIMGVVPTAEIFDEVFIEGLGDRRLLFHPADLKQITDKSVVQWEGSDMVKITTPKKRPYYFKPDTEQEIGNYPNWKAVIPEEAGKQPEDKNVIGVNATLLATLQKALGFSGCRLSFYSGHTAIGVTESNTVTGYDGKAFGIIMPVAGKDGKRLVHELEATE